MREVVERGNVLLPGFYSLIIFFRKVVSSFTSVNEVPKKLTEEYEAPIGNKSNSKDANITLTHIIKLI